MAKFYRWHLKIIWCSFTVFEAMFEKEIKVKQFDGINKK
jgi:hypothetical protein